MAAKVGFVSLGCPKALVDSERIITQLRAEGYEISPDYQGSDVIVINTCGFIDAAKAESLDAIGEAMENNGKVIVTGCLGASGDLVREKYPQVLAVTGPDSLQSTMAAIHEVLPPHHEPFLDLVPKAGIKLTPQHYAYLKISEGCNHKCSFCIIPQLRGKLHSRPITELLTEAKNLVESGVRELLVVSQDTSAYGIDLKYRSDFWGTKAVKSSFLGLTQALAELGVWLRLHYVYPYPHVDDVIPLMARDLVLPYLDIPLQHASPAILKSMKRPAHTENTLERIDRWRQQCPEITLRSTFIVGYPGETQEDFEQLLNFLDKAKLDRVGCFTYSNVDGAPSQHLPDQVEESVKLDRQEQVMFLQESISEEKLAAKVGQVCEVMIDEVTEDALLARSAADAPEIDGLVHIEAVPDCDFHPGDIVSVRITGSDTHDLEAQLL